MDGHSLSDCEAYRRGKRPMHWICAGGKETKAAHDLDLAGCRAACSAEPACAVVHWQGEEKSNYSEASPGQCFFLDGCEHAKEYTSIAYA